LRTAQLALLVESKGLFQKCMDFSHGPYYTKPSHGRQTAVIFKRQNACIWRSGVTTGAGGRETYRHHIAQLCALQRGFHL